MRVIRVSYRATFRQPLGVLNPLGAKLAVPISIEVYESKRECWLMRSPETGRMFENVRAQMSSESAQGACFALFEEQLTPWEMYGEGRALKPEEVKVTQEGKVYLIEEESDIKQNAAKP